MALPKEINPNPLITSTVEIRFTSEINDEDVLGLFYPLFYNTFPKIKEKSKIPFELKRNRPELKFAPDYVLQNDTYSLSIGNNVVAFENVGSYQLWAQYFPFIKKNLEILKQSGVIKNLLRVGIRYVSIFENNKNINEIVNYPNVLQFGDYTQENNSARSDFRNEKVNLHLQVVKNAKVEKLDQNKTIEGLYIDIDASTEVKLPNDINEDLYKIIDHLHTELKKLLFEGIIKKEFLNSLNATY